MLYLVPLSGGSSCGVLAFDQLPVANDKSRSILPGYSRDVLPNHFHNVLPLFLLAAHLKDTLMTRLVSNL